ncbi:19865_t:CDS:2 [Gigaspora margarita]|uniref:19865_t:CDS:1 n=1 Tax=Gigaspora margarita TaxID=4874 RepID=A0ABN7UHS9_GIGMA|nr:19865_t:CDS:2 [Gigaspora margarita]
MPEKRIQIGNLQDGCLVREIDPKLEVLILHENLQAISFTENAPPSTARYYHYQFKNGKEDWIPLLPEYSVFFYIAKTYYKFSIINENYHLKFQWIIYKDDDFKEIKEINSDYTTVATYYLYLYQKNQPLINAKKYEILLQEKLKKKAEEINNLIDAKSKKENPSTLIQHEIFLEKEGKNLLLTSIQALILEHKEKKIKIPNFSWQISHLKKHIEQLESELEQSFEDNELVEDNLLETKCKKCNDIYKYTNEKEIQFAKATATIGLAGGISHNALQSSLATIGITSQIGKKIYNNYQKLYFSSLIASAKSSTTQALQKCIEYAVNQNKEVHEYSHKPIVAFHVVQKSRSIKDNKTELTKTIYQRNFDKSSRQIEHAILIEVINQISSPLEENNLYLDVYVNGDLDSNKTLAHVCIVSKISADLKHLTKNIRNSVLNHIMRWFCGCIYFAKLRKEAKDQFAPSKEEIHKMQIDGLIRHLQNDHSNCWSDICWTKDDSTIIIQNPTLCHSSESQINLFKKFLEKIFYVPVGQIVIYYNEGYTYLLFELRETYSEQCFELEDTLNIGIIEYECSEQNKLNVNKIHQYLRLEQMDTINYYIKKNKDTLVIMKTSGGKFFCYAALSILFDGLTIIILLLKSLIQNQNHFIQLGIPYGYLLALSQGTVKYEAKVCEEIALGFTCLLFVTSKKLLLNKSLRILCKHLYENKKLQFIID